MHDPTPGPSRWSQCRGSQGLCRDQCWFRLPPEDTRFSTRNARLRSQETQSRGGVNKCMISREEAHAKLNEYCETQWSHNELYTDGSRMNEILGKQQSCTAISRMVRQPADTCPKICQDTSTIFAAEATIITVALHYNRHMGPVHHDVLMYSWLAGLLASDWI